MIDAPEPFDVLFGGRRNKPPIGQKQHHPGNKLLRLLIDKNFQRYNRAPSRLERRAIANEIVQGIKSNSGNGKLPGRFLRLCESAEREEEGWCWKEVSDAVASDKVNYCFRARRNLAPEMSSSSAAGWY
jgi:hypothetical protein